MRKPVRINRGAARQPSGQRAAPSTASYPPPQQGQSLGQGCGAVLALVFLLVLIAKCSTPSTQTPDSPTAMGTSEPAYVSARSLNCRREPEATAAVSEKLAGNDRVVIVERRGEWARLTRAGGDCWVSKSFLGDEPSSGTSAAGSAPAQAQGLVSSQAPSIAAGAVAGYAAGKAVRSRTRHAAHRASRRPGGGRRATGGSYYGSECPCSGSRICIGPRGGRFCITSGGNKRYGV